jgi:hypothetical protein
MDAQKIIRLAVRLLRRGKCRGWSEALKMAQEQMQ